MKGTRNGAQTDANKRQVPSEGDAQSLLGRALRLNQLPVQSRLLHKHLGRTQRPRPRQHHSRPQRPHRRPAAAQRNERLRLINRQHRHLRQTLAGQKKSSGSRSAANRNPRLRHRHPRPAIVPLIPMTRRCRTARNSRLCGRFWVIANGVASANHEHTWFLVKVAPMLA